MGDYVGAPYNFVPFGKKVYRKKEIVKYNQIQGLSGYIEYQVTAQTPIMVDGGDKHFYKGKDGKAAIPGSTMRGLVRSNMQVLSQSSVVDDIQNSRLMYRCVGGSTYNPNKNSYKTILGDKPIPRNDGKGSISVLLNVKGGYIKKEGAHYYIIPSVVQSVQKKTGEMNYYILNERFIIKADFKGFEILERTPGILQHENHTEFRCVEKNGRKHYIGKSNYNYKPYWKPIYYLLKDVDKVVALSKEPRKNYKKGALISSGSMREKKAFYVIPQMADIPKDEWILIPDQDVDSYKRDLEGKKNQLGKNKKFYDLPVDEECKPVFYINLDGKIYFGYTPRLRLFYEKGIFDGLPEEHQVRTFDYCKSLFGYTSNPGVKTRKGDLLESQGSYRSRLSFQDAGVDQNVREESPRSMVLGEPKPSSFLDYLTGPGGMPATYRGNFWLRGMKQYWLHEKNLKTEVGKNQRVSSSFSPYPEGTSFTGRIRFTNLDEKELGMLLWSLLLEKDSQQNIGKGKPYGYDRVTISLKELNIMMPDKLYESESLCLDPYENQTGNCEKYIAKAKEDIKQFIGVDVMEYQPIRDFLWMKNYEKKPDEDKIHYMTIGGGGVESDYQNRLSGQVMLDTVGVVLKKEKRRPQKQQNGYRNNQKNGKGQNQGGNNRGNGGYYGNGQKKDNYKHY